MWHDLLDASVAIRSKISLTKEFRMAIALLEIPVSGWTCFNTVPAHVSVVKLLPIDDLNVPL